jgi:hypothetical protein
LLNSRTKFDNVNRAKVRTITENGKGETIGLQQSRKVTQLPPLKMLKNRGRNFERRAPRSLRKEDGYEKDYMI